MAAQTFRRSIPNLLTASRLVLAGPIVVAALQDAWAWGFWLIVVALVTDFLDGWAAKAFKAQTRLGEQLDPIADFSLAAAGMAGIIFSGHLPLWVGLVMLVPAVYVGYVKFLSHDDKIRLMQPVFSVPYLFATWAFIAGAYAAIAYGWQWWYVVLAIAILGAAAIPKRHRLRAWFGWLAERHRS
jgi:phosphatidylglycerophosphate synthase